MYRVAAILVYALFHTSQWPSKCLAYWLPKCVAVVFRLGLCSYNSSDHYKDSLFDLDPFVEFISVFYRSGLLTLGALSSRVWCFGQDTGQQYIDRFSMAVVQLWK